MQANSAGRTGYPKTPTISVIPHFLRQECSFMATKLLPRAQWVHQLCPTPAQPHRARTSTHRQAQGKTVAANISLTAPQSKFSLQIPASFPFAALRATRVQFSGKLLSTHSLESTPAAQLTLWPCYKQSRNLWNALAPTRSSTFSW